MASKGRVEEAEKHLAEAQKNLKSGWFKSADYASAASLFDKAAICFRNSRDHVKAKDAYIKAAECHYNNNAIYHAGKSTEQAANVIRDARQLEDAAELYMKASEYYNESGHPDTAGQVLAKGAQLLQHDNPGMAAKYCLVTAEYYELDEKFREAANSIKNAVRMYCRTRPRQYDDIIKTARVSRSAFLRAGAINLAHEAISVEIIAMLMKGETSLEALDVLQDADKVPEFSASEDRAMLEQLMDAVAQNDDETITECCNSTIFKAMDPEFAKLARDLKKGEDSVEPKRQAKSKDVTKPTKEASNSSPAQVKKTPAQLADMRNQLFTKSTGEKVSSKMPKPRSAYKSKPKEDENKPEPRVSVPEPRGLEEHPPSIPPSDKTSRENLNTTTEEDIRNANGETNEDHMTGKNDNHEDEQEAGSDDKGADPNNKGVDPDDKETGPDDEEADPDNKGADPDDEEDEDEPLDIN